MKQAIWIGVAVLGGVLLGRVQVMENYEANDAIAAHARIARELEDARGEAKYATARLARLETKFLGVWGRLDGMLEDYANADGVIAREAARQRIEQLRWSMDVVEARLVAARAVHLTPSWVVPGNR